MTAKIPFPWLLTDLSDEERDKAYFDALFGAIRPKQKQGSRWRHEGFDRMWRAVFSLRDGPDKMVAVIDMVFATGDVLGRIWKPFGPNGGTNPGLFKRAAQNFDLAGYYFNVALYEGEKNPLRLQLAKMLAYECSAQWWDEIRGSRSSDAKLSFNGWRAAVKNLEETVSNFELPQTQKGLQGLCGFFENSEFRNLSPKGKEKWASLIAQAKQSLAQLSGGLTVAR